MNRRTFNTTGLLGAILGFFGVKHECQADENPERLPVIKFGKDGRPCNQEEIFKGMKFGEQVGLLCHITRETKAWLNKEDAYVDLNQKWWGEVRFYEWKDAEKGYGGGYYEKTTESSIEAPVRRFTGWCKE